MLNVVEAKRQFQEKIGAKLLQEEKFEEAIEFYEAYHLFLSRQRNGTIMYHV